MNCITKNGIPNRMKKPLPTIPSQQRSLSPHPVSLAVKLHFPPVILHPKPYCIAQFVAVSQGKSGPNLAVGAILANIDCLFIGSRLSFRMVLLLGYGFSRCCVLKGGSSIFTYPGRRSAASQLNHMGQVMVKHRSFLMPIINNANFLKTC